mmetsp:Transcript_4159/g.6281  ORF Transcript_4159/g.6281 Transcript_4159/m.6281 type:complete len:263 (+) Transcript_4159:2682-3470(+)
MSSPSCLAKPLVVTIFTSRLAPTVIIISLLSQTKLFISPSPSKKATSRALFFKAFLNSYKLTLFPQPNANKGSLGSSTLGVTPKFHCTQGTIPTLTMLGLLTSKSNSSRGSSTKTKTLSSLPIAAKVPAQAGCPELEGSASMHMHAPSPSPRSFLLFKVTDKKDFPYSTNITFPLASPESKWDLLSFQNSKLKTGDLWTELEALTHEPDFKSQRTICPWWNPETAQFWSLEMQIDVTAPNSSRLIFIDLISCPSELNIISCP